MEKYYSIFASLFSTIFFLLFLEDPSHMFSINFCGQYQPLGYTSVCRLCFVCSLPLYAIVSGILFSPAFKMVFAGRVFVFAIVSSSAWSFSNVWQDSSDNLQRAHPLVPSCWCMICLYNNHIFYIYIYIYINWKSLDDFYLTNHIKLFLKSFYSEIYRSTML